MIFLFAVPPEKDVYDRCKQHPIALTLDTSQRISHQLATAVFKILLRVSGVEIVVLWWV